MEATKDIGDGVILPTPLANCVLRFAELAEMSSGGHDFPVYGGWSLAKGELRITVYGPESAADTELLGRF